MASQTLSAAWGSVLSEAMQAWLQDEFYDAFCIVQGADVVDGSEVAQAWIISLPSLFNSTCRASCGLLLRDLDLHRNLGALCEASCHTDNSCNTADTGLAQRRCSLRGLTNDRTYLSTVSTSKST